MRPRFAIPVTVFGALLTACSPAPQTPVPLVGAAGEMATLAGHWEGAYSSAATGRSGSRSATSS